jgi:hypothetical protein
MSFLEDLSLLPSYVTLTPRELVTLLLLTKDVVALDQLTTASLSLVLFLPTTRIDTPLSLTSASMMSALELETKLSLNCQKAAASVYPRSMTASNGRAAMWEPRPIR